MEIDLVILKTLMPGVPSAKAYQLVFADEAVYFIFLSRDWGGFGGAGSVLGRSIVAAAGAVSHNKIAQELQEIENKNLDEFVEKDSKNSIKLSYQDIKQFSHKKKSMWSGDAFVQFKLRNGGKYKFTFMEEQPRESIIEILKEKCPDIIN